MLDRHRVEAKSFHLTGFYFHGTSLVESISSMKYSPQLTMIYGIQRAISLTGHFPLTGLLCRRLCCSIDVALVVV
jgi:hypothetical protein